MEPTPSRAARADVDLVRDVLSGSPEARAAFVERMKCVPRILAAKNRRLGRPLGASDLEDLVQETILSVWKRLPAFEGRASLETWAYRFCHYRLCKALEKSRRQRAVEPIADGEEGAVAACREAHEFEHVYHALEHVEARDAEVLRLKQFEGLTFEEIGAALEVSPNTAKTRYYRGLDALRRLLGPIEQEERR